MQAEHRRQNLLDMNREMSPRGAERFHERLSCDELSYNTRASPGLRMGAPKYPTGISPERRRDRLLFKQGRDDR